MIGATDYIGLGTLITAAGATIVSIIVALRQTTTHAQLTDVKSAVTTSNGATLGELAETNQARNVAKDAAAEGTP